MTTRSYLAEQIDILKHEIVDMGTKVEAALSVAVDMLEQNDSSQAELVFEQDAEINALRHQIEKKAVTLIATQQPMAIDVRDLVTLLAMSADLERMGDQAKNIVKAFSFLAVQYRLPLMHDLKKMADLGAYMLRKSLIAYLNNDVELATQIAQKDDELDRLFASTYAQMIALTDRKKDSLDTQVSYEILRIAQTLERFGDLATNLAERVIYKVTNKFVEINQDQVPTVR